jgi:two-component system response regulator AtoC
VPIRLAPLRERADDTLLLARHFIERSNARLGKHVESIEPEADRVLLQHSWPGNIRELENVIERAVLFCDGPKLRVRDLPLEVRDDRAAPAQTASTTASPVPPPVAQVTGDGLKQQVKAATSRLERELIVHALDQTRGNVTHAARLLKISRQGLQLKMKELGLRERDGGTET